MGQLAFLIVIAILYGLYKLVERLVNGANDVGTNIQANNYLKLEREKKYGERIIDLSQTLFDRNIDIIQKFIKNLEIHSFKPYYIDNLTRDCLNEICLAENRIGNRPGYSFLNVRRTNAPKDLVILGDKIKEYFVNQQREKKRGEEQKKEIEKRQRQLEREQQQEEARKLKVLQAEVRGEERKLNTLIDNMISPIKTRDIKKQFAKGKILISDVDAILNTKNEGRKDIEKRIIDKKGSIKKIPPFVSDIYCYEVDSLNKKIDIYNNTVDSYNLEQNVNKEYFKKIYNGYLEKSKTAILQRMNYVINNISMPYSFPKIWDMDYDEAEGILIVEVSLPDITHNKIYKEVQLKSKTIEKELTKKEFQDYAPKIHPSILLKLAYEIFKNDDAEVIDLLVINGRVEYDHPATGQRTKTYTSSLALNRDQTLGLNLNKLSPVAAFQNLKGKSSGNIIDIIPVVPTLNLDRKDKRFITTKEIIDNVNIQTNIASMDWQDFENLIAELFQKEFAEKGAEIKVTQASRDRGVDAVIFDPDPIKGGKFIIQAKRYTNTVDVSAVRDLCAVVKKEGASRGILVTTSSYGRDAYTFAQNEPVTLLNGAELLGLLEKHGYKFRINLTEARKLLKSV